MKRISSNFIEGTEFEVAEAAEIVFKGHIPTHRPEDGHDILGVWQVVSDLAGMRHVPGTADELMNLLRARHARVLAGRPGRGPGSFKTTPNRVGTTTFVAPDAVAGTLGRGFDLYDALDTAFARAAFIHFLVTEVHPFADGNGRVARIMMNAELIAANEERIVIPTVYRPDYLAAQRALSVHGEATPVVRMLDFAQSWTLAINWTTVVETEERLQRKQRVPYGAAGRYCRHSITESPARRAVSAQQQGGYRTRARGAAWAVALHDGAGPGVRRQRQFHRQSPRPMRWPANSSHSRSGVRANAACVSAHARGRY